MPISSPSSRTKEAKLFRNNRSQAVRIPVEFELPGDRVLIHREGSKLIIEPITRPTNYCQVTEPVAKKHHSAQMINSIPYSRPMHGYIMNCWVVRVGWCRMGVSIIPGSN
ncbi:hypothetical protein XF_1588 [Xylella fastidiosa 9a5c]|uniref:SpoVT-AbrB domain-containing protein n=2 Tax=Xylella fastidiosa TaxID=2371 RepID=Q9PD16_XYLFA|nr:hypothetical protein XF_1588 [Xylella fastidiosa 9a5c]